MDKQIINIFNNINFSNITKQQKGKINYKDYTVYYEFINKGGQGYVYSVKFMYNNNSIGEFAVKILHKYNKTETDIFTLLSDKVKNKESYNFIQFYLYKKENNKHIYLIEKADGDINKWISEKHTDKEWKSLIIQLLYGLHFLQTNKICHNDFLPRNILYKTLTKDRTLKYKNHTITVNTIFYISDFGHSQSLNFDHRKLTDQQIKLCILNNTDLKKFKFIKRSMANYLVKNYTVNELIDISKNHNDTNVYSYIKNSQNMPWKKKLPSHIKDKMKKKDIAYYLMDKKYVTTKNIDKYSVSNDKLYLPSENIISILQKFTTYTNDIFDLLSKHFPDNIL
jgi:hypothetical protein